MASAVPSHRWVKPTLLVLLSLTLSAPPALAGFDSSELDDTFDLRRGNASECPETIRFETRGNNLFLNPDEVHANGNECTGGNVSLSRSPEDSNATRYFARNDDQFDNFLAGSTSDDLKCGSTVLPAGEQLIFLEPDEDVTVSWAAVFGGETDLERNSDSTFEFDDEEKYLLLGSRCLYDEANLLDRVCFPPGATVRRADGSAARMDALRVGDAVRTGAHLPSKVLGWSHFDRVGRAVFVNATTAGGASLVATASHLVYVDGGKRVAAMGDLVVGDALVTEAGEDARVVQVRSFKGRGVLNPHTMDGNIVVDGFRVTCYTKAVDMGVAHALLTPVRAVFRMVAEVVMGKV